MVRSLLTGLLVLALASPAAVAAVTVTGNETETTPTSGDDYSEGGTESNSTIHWFVEKSDFALSSSQSVQINAPGSYYSGGDSLTGGGLSSGTPIGAVYYVHFDPTGQTATNVGPLTIQFTFSGGELFLGALTDRNTLVNSDSRYGISGVTYDSGSKRGLENADTFTVSADRTVVTITVRNNANAVDNIRILTTPEPTSFALFGLGVLGFAGFQIRRRRAKARK